MPKVVKLFLFVMVTSTAFAEETVINYPDGSTYTLEDAERIYVAEPRKLFTQKRWSNGGVNFSVAEPNKKRDYVPQPQDGNPVGSVAWCEAYVPWSEGLTFNMVSWQRACDTNKDGKYVFCDDYIPTSDRLTFGGGAGQTADDKRHDEECG